MLNKNTSKYFKLLVIRAKQNNQDFFFTAKNLTNALNQREMKYKFKNDFEDVVIATFADYVQNELEVSKNDKKFIQEFAFFNNMDNGHDAIEIVTNDIELCSFVHRIILDYKQYLEDSSYRIIRREDIGLRIN